MNDGLTELAMPSEMFALNSGTLLETLACVFDPSIYSPDYMHYERHYSCHFFAVRKMPLPRFDCSPPTPVRDIEGYAAQASSHQATLSSIESAIGARELRMGPLAQAIRDYAVFLRSLPGEFCINDDNRDAFDNLQSIINAASQLVERGVTDFEANFGTFLSAAVPLLESVKRESDAIDTSSRDFRGVVAPFNQYNDWVRGWSIEIWTLSDRISAFNDSWQRSLGDTRSAFLRAFEQIQQSVESEARRFEAAKAQCDDHFRRWEEIDGLQGYLNFRATLRTVAQDMIPVFNDFLAKVPATDRTRQAVANAQRQIDAMVTTFDSFPSFLPLPPSSDAFPYESYGLSARKFGLDPIVEIVRRACVEYFNATRRRLYVGDMSYEHGGKAMPHRSHRQGIDADVDPIEVGDYGTDGYNAERALQAAQIFLRAGASLTFFADPVVVTNANQWARENGISGRLQVERHHTKHFHLRS
ncbi:penicillin-insensitive murein endopeptidase [Sorangium sp. So ce128]|uniref:penicillin-insensitive murein endopeptidase n=1 Tax=Sorangium sp. So ce128 TaxID=3133281 RepID=UPI003F5F6447